MTIPFTQEARQLVRQLGDKLALAEAAIASAAARVEETVS